MKINNNIESFELRIGISFYGVFEKINWSFVNASFCYNFNI